MGAPIPLPQIKLRVFNPDVSMYHASRLARIRAIGERARQDKIRKEAYQRSLAKEYREISVDKYKFTTDYFHQEQAKMINEFQSWSARQQAQEGKAFSEGELIAAKRYASKIDSGIEAMAFSEDAYKTDGKFVEDNRADIDVDFYNAHRAYDPSEDGLYQDYLRKKKVKASLRELSGTEVSSEINNAFMKDAKIDERVEIYNNKHGDKVTDASKFVKNSYILDADGTPVKPNTKWQFNEISDFLDSNSKWQIGVMKEYDDLNTDKKKFYENLALKKDMLNYKGFHGTDFTDIYDPYEVGDKKDAYKYYYYDKHGDDHYALNSKIKTIDVAIKAEKEKQKWRGGFAVRDGSLVIGSKKPTTVTHKTGDVSRNYYQLGPFAKRSQTGNLVGVVDISGRDEPIEETLSATDYEYYDLIGFDFDYGDQPMAHIRLTVKDAPKYEDGSPVYKGTTATNHITGTEADIRAGIKKQDIRSKKKKAKLDEFEKALKDGVLEFKIQKGTQRLDKLIPVNRNPGATSGFVIDEKLLKKPELVEFDISAINTTGFSERDIQTVEFIKNNPNDPRSADFYEYLISKNK